MFRGKCSSGSKSGFRYSDHGWLFPMGSSSPLLCCESTSEERSAGNRHATLCGSRKRVTASGDPVKQGNSSTTPCFLLYSRHGRDWSLWRSSLTFSPAALWAGG